MIAKIYYLYIIRYTIVKDLIIPFSIKNYIVFYRLPTRGRAGTKLGDVDTSITYL